MEKKTLYTVLSGLHEEYDHCLKIDYGELSELVNEQYWWCAPGHEVSFESAL